MGVMIPAGTDNLVVSDKAISVSNLINGSTRLQPVVLLTGQAAGTLAAIAAREGCTPREVPVRRLQAALLAQDAYIAPLYDVKPDDPDFAMLQRIAATGILRMTASRSSGRTARGSIPSAGSPSVSSAAACTTMRRRSKCPTTPRRLTAASAAAMLRKAGAAVAADGTEPLTRREAARMTDEALHPFDRDIDFEGNLIK